MGKCDETMYHYLAEQERFADLFNAGCFHGRQLVEAGKLEQLAERVQLTERRCWESAKESVKGLRLFR